MELPARGGRKTAPVGRDACDPGPPVGEVVRLGQEEPDVLQRREQFLAGGIGRHGGPTLPEAEQVPDPLAEQPDEVPQAR
jgi:hypothetical protein